MSVVNSSPRSPLPVDDALGAAGQRPVEWLIVLWSSLAAFGTYFAMYGFRKPFTVASFSGLSYWEIDFKTLAVISQVLGYMTSKFIGIKIVSELPAHRRALMLIGLVAWAHAALLLFAVVPGPWKLVCLFFNGLPLGMVFGLVLGFLEGRRHTEILASGLCVSFIVSDGVVKSVGAWLISQGCREEWMPFVAGSIFLLPFLLSTYTLMKVPAPSARDRNARGERLTMDRSSRQAFLLRYLLGLILLTIAYLLVTILRSTRADFAPEIWQGLGYTIKNSDYAQAEMLVGLGVLVIFAISAAISNNRTALHYGFAMAFLGAIILIGTLIALKLHWLDPFSFMVLSGLGLYLPYIAVHTTIFERLIALTRDRATIGYLMYFVDAYGYLGYVVVLLLRQFSGSAKREAGVFIDFYLVLCWAIGLGMAIVLIPCWRSLARVRPNDTPVPGDAR